MNKVSWPVGKSASLSSMFDRLLEQCVLAPARSAGEELSVVAVTEPPPPVTVWHPPEGNTWIAARHDADPVALGRGALHAPEREIARMKRLSRAGIRFDVILIGHELPGRWYPGDPVPEAYELGAKAAHQRTVTAQRTAFELAAVLLQAVVGSAALAVRGVGMATAGAAAALSTLDPLVLGGLADPATGQIAWVYLGGWDEEAA